jgi:serine protease Do
MTSDLAESLGLKQVSGVIVSAVTPDSAADRGGIKRGDVIKSFNSEPVQDYNALRNHVADMTPGSNVSVVVVRDGSEKTFNVKLDEATGTRASRERNGAELELRRCARASFAAARQSLPRKPSFHATPTVWWCRT